MPSSVDPVKWASIKEGGATIIYRGSYGKLSAQNAPSFPQFPQLRLLVIDLFGKLLNERFACFIFLVASMQFLKNLNPCSFYSLATKE